MQTGRFGIALSLMLVLALVSMAVTAVPAQGQIEDEPFRILLLKRAAGDNGPSTYAFGARIIPVSGLRVDEVLGDSDTIQVAQLRRVPLRTPPLRTPPLAEIRLVDLPLRTPPLRTPPLRTPPIETLPLSAVPLRTPGGWTELLRGTIFENAPLQTLTLGDILSLDPLPDNIAALTLADLDLQQSALADASLSAFLLGDLPVAQLPAPSEGWCEYTRRYDVLCDRSPEPDYDPATASLADLESLNVDTTSYLSDGIALRDIDLGQGDPSRTIIGQFPISTIELGRTPLASVKAGDVEAADPAILSCSGNCGGRTLAELQQAEPDTFSDAHVAALIDVLPLPGRSNLTLAQLLRGIVAADEVPFELGPLPALLDQADVASAPDKIEYTLDAVANCPQALPASVVIDIPAGQQYLQGSAFLENEPVIPGPTRSVSPHPGLDRWTFPPGIYCKDATADEDRSDLTFTMAPPVRLMNASHSGFVTAVIGDVQYPGHYSAGGWRTADIGGPSSRPTGGHVVDSGIVRLGFLSSQPRGTFNAEGNNIDFYSFTAPSAGSRVTFSTSKGDGDVDLVLYGQSSSVDLGAQRRNALGTAVGRQSSLDDLSTEPGSDPTVLQQTALQDVPIWPFLPVRSMSANGGSARESISMVVSEEDAGKEFQIQVSAAPRTEMTQPYALRTTVDEPTEIPACLPATSVGEAHGELPAVLDKTAAGDPAQTLILVNEQRMRARFPGADLEGLNDALEAYAARAEVQGVILPVDGDSAVRTASAALDADPCSTVRANKLVEAIMAVVDRAREGDAPLRHLVIVGSDAVIPQARLDDRTDVGNEADYAGALMEGNLDTPASRALRQGSVLSDDPYGDFDPPSTENVSMFVPDVAIGRLLETPQQIVDQLADYAAADGRLLPETGSVLGYDFLSDGAEAVAGALDTLFDAESLRTDFGDDWDAQDAIDALTSERPTITSVNAHYDHNRLLPAAAFNLSGSPDLVDATQTNPAAGSLLFTMGCHAGLNVPDVLVTGTVDEAAARRTDWAQHVTSRGAGFLGNTGFGYGDTASVAFTERLLTQFAGRVSERSYSVGQALMYSKQEYASGLGVIGAYDAKVLTQATMYGPPTWRVGGDGTTADPSLPLDVQGPATAPVTATPFTFERSLDDYERVTESTGSYYTVDGQHPQVTHGEPIVPRTAVDVTGEGGPVHGFWPTALETADIQNFDPAIVSPTLDNGTDRPEPLASNVVFPSWYAAPQVRQVPGARQDLLAITPGQFRYRGATGGLGTQRLVTKLAGDVLHSESGDYEPPSIVDGGDRPGTRQFFARTTANDDTAVQMLWRDNVSAEWKRLPLTKQQIDTDLFEWTASYTLQGGARVREFVIVARDAAGNVAVSTNKGAGDDIGSISGARIIVTPPPATEGGWQHAAPTVSLDRGSALPGERFSVVFRGDESTRRDFGSTPIAIPAPAEGVIHVEAIGTGGSYADTYVRVDSVAPTITAATSRPPDVMLGTQRWHTAPVTVNFTCFDASSGIDPAGGCPTESVNVSDEGTTTVAPRTARDISGLTSQSGPLEVNVDTLAPQTGPPGFSGATMRGTATDAASGVARVSVRFSGLFGSVTREATVTCSNATRRSCTYAVSPPSGIWFGGSATASDRVGRADPTPASF